MTQSCAVMDSLKEFLESSTIHGLVYISSARNKTSKVLWLLVVLAGFSVAGYLITSSLQDWEKSPISTTITTHPIREAPFPRVAVCPPKGTNTALNLVTSCDPSCYWVTASNPI